MRVNAKADAGGFYQNRRSLAEVWGLVDLADAGFFDLIRQRIDGLREDIRAAGCAPSLVNVVKVHHDTMDDENPVDVAVMAALTWVADRMQQPQPLARA